MGQVDKAMIYFTLAAVCIVVGALAYVGDNIPQAGFTDEPLPKPVPTKDTNLYQDYVNQVVTEQRDLLAEHEEANP